MKRSERFPYFEKAPKKAPPKHGIKVKKLGATWWGQRWIQALENVLLGDANRLARGRSYARAGRTHDLIVADGKVAAKVTGSRATPYEVAMTIKSLPNAVWGKAIAGMAEKAEFAAELLSGEMPEHIDEVFRAAGSSLFPVKRAELKTSCSCPDWGDPCKHVAATHYVLGEAFDRDPFLLFELRGRTREQVLQALRIARSGGEGRSGSESAMTSDVSEPELSHVSLGTVSDAEYDSPRQALPALQFSFDAPNTHGALLRQLGVPSAWSGANSPAEALTPILQAAAEKARSLALSEQSQSSVSATKRVPTAHTEKPGVSKRKREKPRQSSRVSRAKPRAK